MYEQLSALRDMDSLDGMRQGNSAYLKQLMERENLLRGFLKTLVSSSKKKISTKTLPQVDSRIN